MIPAADAALLRQSQEDALEKDPGSAVRRWAKGESSLHEIKGYTAEELFNIARHGYSLYLNGKFKDAQTVFEGLVALDPRNDYYYRALGVVYHRRGEADRAIRQFTHALKVSPRSTAAYVNRAEVHISRRDKEEAIKDLDSAIRSSRDPNDAHARKAMALRSLLRRTRMLR